MCGIHDILSLTERPAVGRATAVGILRCPSVLA
jgi:hypothetical protein